MSTREGLMEGILENAVTEVERLDSSDSEIDETMDDAAEAIYLISSMRYFYRSAVPKNLFWFEETLHSLDDKRFKMLIRCSREKFNTILNLITDSPVFHGKNSQKQFTPYFQLALVMYRLGSKGTGASIGKIATLFGVGDGGTIYKVTMRVFRAILELENEYLRWPTDEEKIEIIFETSDEHPHCIGYLDATEIPLEDAPFNDHVSYCSRKKQYSIKMQTVCDFRLMIRHVVIGWPGSAHDARIFNESKLAKNPEEYFSGLEWLAADCAYTLTERVITPFRSNSSTLTPIQRLKFNKFFSSKRVRIEHVYAILKNIFPSLQCLSIHVNKESHEIACTWIRVCCILYNILRPSFDNEDLQPNLQSDEDEDEEMILMEPEDIAEAKRIALYGTIFNEDV